MSGDGTLHYGAKTSDTSRNYVFNFSYSTERKGKGFDLFYTGGDVFLVIPDTSDGVSSSGDIQGGFNFIGTNESISYDDLAVFTCYIL